MRPDLEVIGAYDSPPAFKQALSSLCSWTYFLGLGFTFGGRVIMGALGINYDSLPPIFHNIEQNKMMTIGALFAINTIGNSLMSTGSFECYVGDALVYSKLATGKVPSADYLLSHRRNRWTSVVSVLSVCGGGVPFYFILLFFLLYIFYHLSSCCYMQMIIYISWWDDGYVNM